MVINTYSSNDLLEESSQSSVNIVGENSNDFLGSGLDVTSHVLVEHGLDLSAVTLVLLEDSTTAEKTSLLSGIPVELDCVGGLTGGDARVGQQHTEGFQNGDSSRSIVV
jgi:hypothetical protein